MCEATKRVLWLTDIVHISLYVEIEFKFIFPLILSGEKNILFMGQTFIILLTYYMMIYNLKIFYHFCLKFYF